MPRQETWDDVNAEAKREVLLLGFRGIRLIGGVLDRTIDETQFISLADQLIKDSILIGLKYKL